MVPYADLRAQYHSIKHEIDTAVLGVLESTQFILGEEVAAFEREFARYCASSDAVAANSAAGSARGLWMAEMQRQRAR